MSESHEHIGEPQKSELSRRDFLRRLGLGAGLAAGVCASYAFLHDFSAPELTRPQKALSSLGDFSLKDWPGGTHGLAVVRGNDRAAMLDLAIKSLGGIEKFIAKGDNVLLKVNAAFATPASLGATTSPELVSCLARLCLAAGAAKVSLTDNPINNPESCFEISGLGGAARESGAKIILPKAGLFAGLTLPGAKLIKDWPVLAGTLSGVTKVILVSPVKDHHRAGASMNLKNMYGFLGGKRNVFHQDINGIISELGQMLKPTLCVLDGTVSMISNGPTGGSLSDLKQTGTLIVSRDPVAADAIGAGLLGREISDLPYLKMAEAAGVGVCDYKSLNPLELTLGA